MTIPANGETEKTARKPQLVGEERQRVRAEAARIYGSGATIKETAAQIGRSYGLTNRLIEEGPVAKRRRGGHPAKPTVN